VVRNACAAETRQLPRLQVDELRVFDGDQNRDNFGVWVDFLQGRLIGVHLAGIAIDEVVRGGDGIGFVIDDFHAVDDAR